MNLPTNKELGIAPIVETAPEVSASVLARPDDYEIPKRRILAKAAALTGTLVMATSVLGLKVDKSLAEGDGAAVPAVPMRSVATASGELAPAKWTGVLEDAAKQPTQAAADSKMALVQDLVPDQSDQDKNVYIKESLWVAPGQTTPDPTDFANLENSIRAAENDNYNVCLAVWPFTWGEGKNHYMPPLSPGRLRAYVTFLATTAHLLRRDLGTDPVNCWVIGNEPNNSTFWWPQYTREGTDAAAKAYERMLARSYDVLKAISPSFVIIGGELASHGNNDPHAHRKSHSPEAFIRDFGQAYRDSGRKEPIMDIFGYHPYGYNSSDSPATVHNNPDIIGVADYDRLVKDLGAAFDGTAQPGSTLPILYDEYGDESLIPGPQAYRYHHKEPKASGAVDETVQAENYRTYLSLAACQPNVIGAFIFHTMDERDRRGWQSGVYYSDGAPKTSQPVVSKAMTGLSEGTDYCKAAK